MLDGISQTDLAFVADFFVYGLALFSLGLAITLEARRSSAIELAASLKYLAAFGFLGSAAAWLDAGFVLGGSSTLPDEMPPVRVISVLLLAGSATALLLFGVRLLVGLDARHRWLRPIPWLLFVAWLVSLVIPHVGPVADAGHPVAKICLECHQGQAPAFVVAAGNWVTGADIWAHYLLYFPGSILAALALLAYRPRFRDLGMGRPARYCVIAAVAFVPNALVSGLVVPPAPYAPASILNYATFLRWLGVPPQVFSALVAMAIAYCVVQILAVFEMERRRQLALANEERFAAQQAVLEADRRAQAELAEWNRHLETKVRERTRQLEELHARLKDLAVLEERDRIARELHDSLAQVLGYLGLRASVLAGQLAAGRADRASDELMHIQQVADDAYADVREAILGLRTRMTDRELVPTLEDYLGKFSLQTGIHSAVDVADASAARFTPTAEIQLLRIIQEALSNARKHAGAEHVRIRFWLEGNFTAVAVEDDGRGFDPTERPTDGHFGLATMRERAESIGGRLTIESAPGRGTRIVVRLPVGVAQAVGEATGGKQ